MDEEGGFQGGFEDADVGEVLVGCYCSYVCLGFCACCGDGAFAGEAAAGAAGGVVEGVQIGADGGGEFAGGCVPVYYFWVGIAECAGVTCGGGSVERVASVGVKRGEWRFGIFGGAGGVGSGSDVVDLGGRI